MDHQLTLLNPTVIRFRILTLFILTFDRFFFLFFTLECLHKFSTGVSEVFITVVPLSVAGELAIA